MKLTKERLQQIIREEMAHARHNLGKNAADVDFPIVVGYELLGEPQSEIAYDQDELDSILDYIAPTVGGPGIPYSLDSLKDVEPDEMPIGADIEQLAAGKKIKITKSQLRRIIKEATDVINRDTGEIMFFGDKRYVSDIPVTGTDEMIDDIMRRLGISPSPEDMRTYSTGGRDMELSGDDWQKIKDAADKIAGMQD